MSDNVPNKLTPKQELMLASLLSGNSHSVTAKAIDCNERTLCRWLALPHVKEAYDTARRDSFTQAMNALAVYALDAVATVHTVMDTVEHNPANGTRLRAAQLILEHAIQIHQVEELEQQVEELSQLVKAQQEEKRR